MPKSVDVILTNALVLTMDEDFTQYIPGAVAVQGDNIVAVGPADEINDAYAANETVDCNGEILMPGLVNAHTHVPMTLLRGLADDLRLVRFAGVCPTGYLIGLRGVHPFGRDVFL